MPEPKSEHICDGTCAVHEVTIDHLKFQIHQIDKGQQEMKELMLKHHEETLDGLQTIAQDNRQSLDKVQERFTTEIDRVREQHHELADEVQTIRLRLGWIGGGAVVAATIIPILLNVAEVFTGILK